jgi:hypothetical protein
MVRALNTLSPKAATMARGGSDTGGRLVQSDGCGALADPLRHSRKFGDTSPVRTGKDAWSLCDHGTRL